MSVAVVYAVVLCHLGISPDVVLEFRHSNALVVAFLGNVGTYFKDDRYWFQQLLSFSRPSVLNNLVFDLRHKDVHILCDCVRTR